MDVNQKSIHHVPVWVTLDNFITTHLSARLATWLWIPAYIIMPPSPGGGLFVHIIVQIPQSFLSHSRLAAFTTSICPSKYVHLLLVILSPFSPIAEKHSWSTNSHSGPDLQHTPTFINQSKDDTPNTILNNFVSASPLS